MAKVVYTDDEGHNKIVRITEAESCYDILRYFHIKPDTKIVYLNGQLISNQKIKDPINRQGTIFMSVKTKTVAS